MSRVSLNLIAGLAVAIALSFLSTAYYKNMINQENIKPISTSTLSKQAARRIHLKSSKEKFIKWENDKPPYKSAAEASKKLPFVLKSPATPAAGELFGFYVTKPTKRDAKPSAWIYLIPPGKKVNKLEGIDPRAGITIYACSEPVKPNFAAKAEDAMQAQKDGRKKCDKPHVLVDVNGLQGQGEEPGYNNLSADYRAPRAGFVSWWDAGVSYTIYGTPGPEGTDLNTMLEIARSMK